MCRRTGEDVENPVLPSGQGSGRYVRTAIERKADRSAATDARFNAWSLVFSPPYNFMATSAVARLVWSRAEVWEAGLIALGLRSCPVHNIPCALL